MKVLVHIEQYDVVGILPSQLESLALVKIAAGVTDTAYVDNTSDGFSGISGFTRYGDLDAFFAAETGPFIAFSPTDGTIITSYTAASGAWLLFGPSMGWGNLLDGKTVDWVKVPGGTLNSRDVVPIALWELSSWQVP